MTVTTPRPFRLTLAADPMDCTGLLQAVRLTCELRHGMDSADSMVTRYALIGVNDYLISQLSPWEVSVYSAWVRGRFAPRPQHVSR